MPSPDFNTILGNLFRSRIPLVPEHIIQRLQNGDTYGASSRRDRDVDFIETDLRRYLAEQPDLKPFLKIEDKRIDYCISSDAGTVGARCEMKGPARQNLLSEHDGKWYRRIKEDVEKQCSRSQAEPCIKHYVAIMVYGSSTDVTPGFEKYCLKPLQRQLPFARIGATMAETTVDGKLLTVFLMSVEWSGALYTGMTPLSQTNDLFYAAMRAFIKGEATWEATEKAVSESHESLHQRRAMRQLIQNGLANPETSSLVLDWILSRQPTAPNGSPLKSS